MNRNGFGTVGIIVIVVLALGLVAVVYFVGQKGKTSIAETQIPVTTTLEPTPTQAAASASVATDVTDQMRFTSPAAGISFLFTKSIDGEPIDVKEAGDTIYVYFANRPYTQGQYVKIFQKSPSDSLDQAIQKTLLTGIDPKDCFVKSSHPDGGAKFPATYEVRTLGYPSDPNSELPAFAQENKCPPPYPETNGVSYFLGDTAHPNIFLFFSIGQYGIPSAPGSPITWQDTVEFLN